MKSINNVDTVEFSDWIKTKAKLRYDGQIPQFPIYNNFIYWCDLGKNIGSEQDKVRPVIILKTSKNSPICAIIPLTSRRLNDYLNFHIDLDIIDSTALVEQVKVVSKLRFINPFRKKGKLITISQNDYNRINKQLENLYRLRPIKINAKNT